MDDLKRIFRRSHRLSDKSPKSDDEPEKQRSRSFTRNLLPPRFSQPSSTSKRTVQLSAYHEPGSPDSAKKPAAPSPGAADQSTRKRSTSRHKSAAKSDIDLQDPRRSESNVPPGTALSPDSPTNGATGTAHKVTQPSERASHSASKTPSKSASASDSPMTGNNSPSVPRSKSVPRHRSIQVNGQATKATPNRFGEDVAERNLVGHDVVPPVPKLPRQKPQARDAFSVKQDSREKTPPSWNQGQRVVENRPDMQGRTSTFTSASVPPQRERESSRAKTMSNVRLDGFQQRGQRADSSGSLPIADQVGRTSSMTLTRDHSSLRRTKWKNKFSSASYYALPEAPSAPTFGLGTHHV